MRFAYLLGASDHFAPGYHREIRMPTAKTAAKTAATKAAPEVTPEQQEIAALKATIEEMVAKFEDLEIVQRLWIKSAKGAELFRKGTTQSGNKKLTFYAAKSTKDAKGEYQSGAWKTLIVTDNGHGPNASNMEAFIAEGHRQFNFEMFEKTYTGRDGRSNSCYYVTKLEPYGTPGQPKQEAPALDEVDDLI